MFYRNCFKLNKAFKIVSFILACGITFGFTSVFASHVPKIPIKSEETFKAYVNLPVDDIVTGDLVYIKVISDNAKVYDLQGFEAQISYDKNVLKYVKTEYANPEDADFNGETENANAHSLIKKETTDNGVITIAAALKGENKNACKKDVSNDGTVCTVAFSALTSGKSEVVLKSLKTVYENNSTDEDLTADPGPQMYYSENIADGARLEVSVKSLTSDTEDSGYTGSTSGSYFGGGLGGGISGVGLQKPQKDSQTSDKNNDYISNGNNGDDSVNKFAFSDIDYHWAKDYIIKLYKDNYITGYEDNTFRPDDFITRAEFASVMHRATSKYISEKIKNSEVTSFFDVKDADWFAESVNNLASLEIINGDNGYFMPYDNILRQDAAVIVSRWMDVTNKSVKVTNDKSIFDFKDATDISAYAIGHVQTLYGGGIVTGDADRCFYPKNEITRGEAAAMLFKLLENL